MSTLPLIVDGEQLSQKLEDPQVLVVDVSSPETHIRAHVPGAVFLEYAWIVDARPPRVGLLPSAQQLGNVLGFLGITPQTHVVACDDEGGGRACRLLWTLDVIGHRGFSLLDGGINAWLAEQRPVTDAIHTPTRSQYPVGAPDGHGLADKDYILTHLEDPDVVLLDARSPAEYNGSKVFAQRGGHIPGAVNLEWTRAMDRQRELRLRPAEELRIMLAELGVTPNKEVITYCQSHHRSAYTYIMLKSLGFERVRGYPGSWSDWGNEMDTPVAQ
ncbi:MAG TPA: sulfurtransferase [Gammaproteobacteria bacterium]|nr:sulfurtransferase [Gammaproteobacteria bacterium]